MYSYRLSVPYSFSLVKINQQKRKGACEHPSFIFYKVVIFGFSFINRRNFCDAFLFRLSQIVYSLRLLTSTSNTLTFSFHYLHAFWSFSFLSLCCWKLYDSQWRYHSWSDFSLRLVYFHILIRILTFYWFSISRRRFQQDFDVCWESYWVFSFEASLSSGLSSFPFLIPHIFETSYWRPYTIHVV